MSLFQFESGLDFALTVGLPLLLTVLYIASLNARRQIYTPPRDTTQSPDDVRRYMQRVELANQVKALQVSANYLLAK